MAPSESSPPKEDAWFVTEVVPVDGDGLDGGARAVLGVDAVRDAAAHVGDRRQRVRHKIVGLGSK